MKPATQKESLEVTKVLIKKRLRAKGFFQFTDKWVEQLALDILAKSNEPIMKIGE